MAVRAGASVGRSHVPGMMRFDPSHASYIRAIKTQMDQIVYRLEKTIKSIKDVTPEAVIYGLEPIMELSQEYVPVDSGDLKRSGFIEARKTSDGVRAVIGYAKNGVPHYAAWVHEMMHIPHAKGKSAKFLERALNERIHIFKYRVVDYIKQKAGLGSQW